MLDEILFREGNTDELFLNVECPQCEGSHDYVVSRDTVVLRSVVNKHLNGEAVSGSNQYMCYVTCPNCAHIFEVNLSP